jgi:uncharacterized small protein (DUF1192 family)
MFEDDIAPRLKIAHEIGQDLSPLSIDELDQRIVFLRVEIDRLEQEKRSKQSTVAAADAFFKT